MNTKSYFNINKELLEQFKKTDVVKKEASVSLAIVKYIREEVAKSGKPSKKCVKKCAPTSKKRQKEIENKHALSGKFGEKSKLKSK